ncbi:MAG TPA: serine hydrolase domain-containing protein, partial [Kofleriaceae bacterium]|nr:serine hydrolase domain-containing protein [Kofleriaceae bacterium]
MLRTAILIATIAGCAAKPHADGSSITPARIDDTVTRVMRAAEVTGVGIAIFEHGQPVYVHAYGLRDVEHTLPLTPGSVMTAASLTKAAFAYLVMTLVDDGTLDLDRPIRTYLDKPLAELPNYTDLAGDARADKLTARMLLDHTSGFANWRSLEDDRKLAFHFEPGTRFAYSGEGIAVLQLVVETVTHTPLDQLMETRVFRPLGMTRTSMIWQPRFEADHADGHDESGRSLGPQRRTRPDAAGGMQT